MKKVLYILSLLVCAVESFAQPTIWGGAKIYLTQNDTSFVGSAGALKNYMSPYFPSFTVTANVPTEVLGIDGSDNACPVTLGSGVTLSSGELPLWNSQRAGSTTTLSSTTLADVTGMTFPVTNGLEYEFEFIVKYSASSTSAGSTWSSDFTAGTVQLSVHSPETSTTEDVHYQNAKNSSAMSASSAFTSGNIAIIKGIYECTSTGTFKLRGAAESTFTITVQAVSVVNWREIK